MDNWGNNDSLGNLATELYAGLSQPSEAACAIENQVALNELKTRPEEYAKRAAASA